MTDQLRRAYQRLRSIFRRTALDQELNLELAAHLALAIEENLQRGMSAEEARRQALIRFGGTEQAREIHREARGLPALEIFFQDLRYALRGTVKNPGFTTAAVLTLALGIAVNATMFSMVSGFLLQRPPGRDPERVVAVSSVNPAGGPYSDANPVSAPNYLAWREANGAFEDMAAADEGRTVNLNWRGHTEALASASVSPNYFTVLGVSAELGRVFSPADVQPGSDHVVILSHGLWSREFGSDPSVIGRMIRLDREEYSVAGVMPANFHMMGFTSQVWTPLVLTAADQTDSAHKKRSLYVFARLKPGVTLNQARAQLAALAHRTQENFPEIEKGWGAAARTLPDFLIYQMGIGSTLVLAMTVVGFVLLIACANVAGLLLSRAGARRKELAIRMSLGAGRLRIIRQLLTEGLTISMIGGGAGLVLAWWGIKFLRAHLAFNEAVRAIPLSLDTNVLAFTLGVSVLSAILCSLAPALTASRTDINASLKNEGRAASAGRSHSRLRTLLVTTEIAMALFLLVGTGLLLRGIFQIFNQDLGFRQEHLLTAGLTLDKARYKEASQQALFVQDLLPRLQQMPGVQAVAAASSLPSGFESDGVTLRIQGRPEPPVNQRPNALDVVATSGYFQTAGIPLLRGRTFAETDNADAPRVVVVNQEFVRRYLGAQDPLAAQIRLDVSSATPGWSRIIGVVGDVKTYSEDNHVNPQVYEPFLQRPTPSLFLLLRTSSGAGSLAPALRKAVAQQDADLPLTQVMTMTAVLDTEKGGSEFFLKLLSTFALLALGLSGVGIYGLISYSVGQRTHELAIRMALGAKSRDVRIMVLWEGLKMAGTGAAIGLALALPLPKAFAAMFNGIHTSDPRTYIIVLIAIFLVALLAIYIPARRASSIDPMRALHSE